MKKALFTIALALFAVTGFAQQALFSRNVVKSPEINADNSVTFRLHAPKAITVQLTGDCVDGVVSMKEDSLGVWSYTTPKLEPELYSYSFIVNGMRMLDPSNIYQNRDVATWTSIFIISEKEGDKGDLYSVNKVPHGNLSKVWYESPTLKLTRRMTVYTPAGYEKGKNSPYCISNYTAVAPEFGTIDDFKNLAKVCHEHQMAIILDWVANHTAWDHPWLKEHPDWYTHDEETDTIIHPRPWDWLDVADLNYDSRDMRRAMIDAMKFWITEVGIDGFRCDVADGVPADFWKEAIDELRQAAQPRKIVMLAEGKNIDNFTVGDMAIDV